jgi:hypothetical protein
VTEDAVFICVGVLDNMLVVTLVSSLIVAAGWLECVDPDSVDNIVVAPVDAVFISVEELAKMLVVSIDCILGGDDVPVLNEMLDKVIVLVEIKALEDEIIVLAIEIEVDCSVFIELVTVDGIDEPVSIVPVGVVLTVVKGEDSVYI